MEHSTTQRSSLQKGIGAFCRFAIAIASPLCNYYILGFAQIDRELRMALDAFRRQYGEDPRLVVPLQGAIGAAQNRDEGRLKANLRARGDWFLEFARGLSLNLLTFYITRQMLP
ncbi:MAG: hypothetical protein LBD02_02980 [Christensenellaceae bacterium]|nr:hypothetical protein [Christensenellaceae bacterium]